MRPACACVSGGEGHLFPLWWASAAVTTFACHGWGAPTRGSRPQVGCSPVGLLHHLRVTGSRDEVTLPRGHRGIRPHLPGGRQRGDSFRSRPMSADGLVRSCRRAASRDEGVRAPRALLVVGHRSIRHRGRARTKGCSDGTGARGHVRTE